MLTARILPWKIVSYGATLFFGACVGGSLFTGGAYIALVFLLFFLPSLYLVLFFGNIRISDTGIQMFAPVGEFKIDWSEVTSIEFGQSHIILKGSARRLVIPQFTFWSPKSQKLGASAFHDITKAIGVTPEYRYSADFKIYKNTKTK